MGGILECLEGVISLEAFRQVLCALCTEVVILEAASKEVCKRRALSAALLTAGRMLTTGEKRAHVR